MAPGTILKTRGDVLGLTGQDITRSQSLLPLDTPLFSPEKDRHTFDQLQHHSIRLSLGWRGCRALKQQADASVLIATQKSPHRQYFRGPRDQQNPTSHRDPSDRLSWHL